MFAIAIAAASLVIFTDSEMREKVRKSTVNLINGAKNLMNEAKKKTPIYLEMYKNTSLKEVVELCTFKLRTSVSTRLETGLLRRPSTDSDIAKKFYDLIYYDGTNRYVVRFPKVRGPSNISHILDDTGADVTSKIKEYLGPSHNFHGIPTTPISLGYNGLTFVTITGKATGFQSNDRIQL